MRSFVEAIRKDIRGHVIKNSVFLPFHCELISIWIGKEMSFVSAPELIVDLCDTGEIAIREGETYTNLVFRKWNNLGKELGNQKGHIILHSAEKGADIFLRENLRYIRISFHDQHDSLSFEIIDNPLDL
jgi:hypothetical protein